MLIKQQNYLNFTNNAYNLASNTQCLDKYKQELEILSDNIKSQELLVPVIGGFSSGKSNLINNF